MILVTRAVVFDPGFEVGTLVGWRWTVCGRE